MTYLFCFGLGYSALALADRLELEDWKISGTCRSEEKARALAGRGIEALVFDRGRPLADAAAALARVTHLLSSVPPGADGDPVLHAHADAIMAAPRLTWVGYLSTTGVYGDRDGGWVDETTPVAPTTDRGERRLAAETAWLELCERHGLPVHIFRLPGIYGPGRNQFAALRAGAAKRIDKPGQVFSRIHVADLAQALHASMARPNPGAVYNVCDDEAAPPQDVVAYAAGLLDIEPPPLTRFDEAELTPMARSFYAENKRVRNDRIKRELGVKLVYPSYREGLTAISESEG
jgi:nucleoside-diphosphate-sugar epimerase